MDLKTTVIAGTFCVLGCGADTGSAGSPSDAGDLATAGTGSGGTMDGAGAAGDSNDGVGVAGAPAGADGGHGPTPDAGVAMDAALPPDDSDRCEDYRRGERNVYWGDLHVHTAYSADAFGFGTRGSPRFAYRFARKKSSVKAVFEPGGPKVEIAIDRPLDFAAVTDHSEFLGQRLLCEEDDHELYGTPYCTTVRARKDDGLSLKQFKDLLTGLDAESPNRSERLSTDAWELTIDAANEADDPCNFTAFIGYEWTKGSKLGTTATFHKNVIFAGEQVPQLAHDAVHFPRERDLWNALDAHCDPADGCEVMTIPHNTNKSRGLAFAIQDDPDDLHALRTKYDQLVEVFQGKGESECLALDPEDKSADCAFEKLPLNAGNSRAVLRRGYARHALKRGLRMQQSDGNNPLQFGLIGSTDTHRANPGNVLESKWGGNHGTGDNTPGGRLKRLRNNAGGLAGVWAEENTRRALFDALKERRVFATSGPRIAVELFQTWSSVGGDPCKAGFEFATPMGGVMGEPPAPDARPVFVVRAAKDEKNLQQVDFVIAASDLDGDAVTETRETRMATGDKGDATMCVSFEYDGYDPAAAMFVYARVLQRPTPRWSAYDCEVVGKCGPGEDIMINERAWTSPIWSVP